MFRENEDARQQCEAKKQGIHRHELESLWGWLKHGRVFHDSSASVSCLDLQPAVLLIPVAGSPHTIFKRYTLTEPKMRFCLFDRTYPGRLKRIYSLLVVEEGSFVPELGKYS